MTKASQKTTFFSDPEQLDLLILRMHRIMKNIAFYQEQLEELIKELETLLKDFEVLGVLKNKAYDKTKKEYLVKDSDAAI